MNERGRKAAPAGGAQGSDPRGGRGAPLGTHSLTGSSEAVGIPNPPGRSEHKGHAAPAQGTQDKPPPARRR